MSVEVGGTAPFFYQWFQAELPIPGATNACYQTPPIAEILSSPLYFWVEVSNACNRVQSSGVFLYFHWDAFPQIVGATAAATNKFLVLFGSPILAGSATNYVFQPARNVSGVVRSASDPALVELTLSEDTPLSEGVAYTLTARGITDTDGNHNFGDVTSFQFVAGGLSTSEGGGPSLKGFRIATWNMERLILVWDGDGVLQGAYELSGPWQEFAASASPYVLDLKADTCAPLPRFFRLRNRNISPNYRLQRTLRAAEADRSM
jgi:hypothetical protein